ncbi:BadF/BadG/BcrA/BcrD ATPase family protein [Actinopolymorpha sp. B9G3]|uniref:N-acetylglucosamine kinase n=1 Tax=Actinopolymorpha sp. B9G3 TaxID=3158970 RepID=UPI0032D94DCF
MTGHDTFISIDGGKSQLRLLVAAGDHRQVGVGAGMVYQPGEDGVDRIVAAIREAAAAIELPTHVTGVVAGLTGVPGDIGLRRQLTRRLEVLLRGPALVVEDVYLAHAGALNGPGTVLCVGTGTNVLAVGATGGYTSLDGWGPILGDRGSGYAIGLAGLRAAAAALDGVGRRTALTENFPDTVGGTDLASLQQFYRDPQLAARVSSFARFVVDAADRDDVAHAICEAAVEDLVAVAEAAATRQPDAGRLVSHSGRLVGSGEFLRRRLGDELGARGLELVEPMSSPLEGGLTLMRGGWPYASVVAYLRERTDVFEAGESA